MGQDPIQALDDFIVTTWGEDGGDKVLCNSVKSEGKNIGRSNETTPEEQAELDEIGINMTLAGETH